MATALLIITGGWVMGLCTQPLNRLRSQEEVLVGHSKREFRRNEAPSYSRSQRVTSTPSASPTQFSTPLVDDKKISESSRSRPSEDKLTALKNYRRAKGLCFKCGAKWDPTHVFSNSIPLHVVEELLQLMQDSTTPENPVDSTDVDSGDDLMEISLQAVNGIELGRTVRIWGSVLNLDVVMLVDSGSSASFISEGLASYILDWEELSKPIMVRVADGGVILCTHEIPLCSWKAQGHSFQTTFKVLPLKCYAVILGMDWLESHSPMEVDCAEKWISFCHNSSKIKLQGLSPNLQQCSVISHEALQSMEKEGDICCIVELYSAETVQEPPQLPEQIQTIVDS